MHQRWEPASCLRGLLVRSFNDMQSCSCQETHLPPILQLVKSGRDDEVSEAVEQHRPVTKLSSAKDEVKRGARGKGGKNLI